MANQVITTVIGKSDVKTIVHVYLESDGNEGELINYVIVDPAVLYPELSIQDQRANRHIVTQLWYSLSWFDVLLSFDELNPVPSWQITRDTDTYVDLRYFGGISDRYPSPKDKTSTDRLGRVLITTKDFAPLGSTGTIVIELKRGMT